MITQPTNSQIASIDGNRRTKATVRFLNSRFQNVNLFSQYDEEEIEVPHRGMAIEPYNDDMLYIRVDRERLQEDVIEALEEYDDVRLHTKNSIEGNHEELKFRVADDRSRKKIAGVEVAENRFINSLIVRSKIIDIKGLTGEIPDKITTYDDSNLYDSVAGKLAQNDVATKIKFGNETVYYTRDIETIMDFYWASD